MTTTATAFTLDERVAARDSITHDMVSLADEVRECLESHRGGSKMGLADARGILRQLQDLGAVLDRLDPPGWRDVLGPDEA